MAKAFVFLRLLTVGLLNAAQATLDTTARSGIGLNRHRFSTGLQVERENIRNL